MKRMTSWIAQMDSELLVLLLFWGIVVVALIVSTAAREIHDPEELDIGDHHPQKRAVHRPALRAAPGGARGRRTPHPRPL
jgi:hypothetical protein